MKIRILTILINLFTFMILILIGLLSPLFIINWVITGKASLNTVLDTVVTLEQVLVDTLEGPYDHKY